MFAARLGASYALPTEGAVLRDDQGGATEACRRSAVWLTAALPATSSPSADHRGSRACEKLPLPDPSLPDKGLPAGVLAAPLGAESSCLLRPATSCRRRSSASRAARVATSTRSLSSSSRLALSLIAATCWSRIAEVSASRAAIFTVCTLKNEN
jgi:hypothetical protein